jgi:cell division protein FtsQ
MKSLSEGKKMLIKKTGKLLIWILLVCFLLLALFLSNKEANQLRIKKVIVLIYPENIEFINRSKVNSILESNTKKGKVNNADLKEINAAQIEKKLMQNDFLSDAKIYNDLSGNLFVKLNQRVPILRIFRNNGVNFYIDKWGVKFQTTKKFSAHVLIANGNSFERLKLGDTVYSFVAKSLYKIANYVDKNVLWKAQIEQIFVTADNEFILIPKIGDHKIVFGDANDLEKKFQKLEIFYKEGLSKIGWNVYESIDVRFENQIVCKKNKIKRS